MVTVSGNAIAVSEKPVAVSGTRSTVRWSADGRTVEKRYDGRWGTFLGLRWEPFERERRIGALLARQPLPSSVPAARLVRADRRRRALVFEAVHGDVLGPKYPLDLADGDVDGLIALASSTAAYRPRRASFLRRFDLERRLRRAVTGGNLSAADAVRFRALARDDPPTYVFAHGDVTARNVIKRAADGTLVLIDWEWAGWYPAGWELAFLWFTLIDLPGGRARVEAAVARRDDAWFWRSALLVQLLHLDLPNLAEGSPFRAKHLTTRDELVERVLA